MRAHLSTRAGFGFVVLASLLFGTTGTAQQLSDLAVSGLYIGAARQIVGGLLMILLVIMMGQRGLLALFISKHGILAAVGTLIYQVTFFVGIANNGVSVGTVTALGSAPIFTAILSYLMLKERIRILQAAIYTIVAAGIWLLLVGFSAEIELTLGILASLAAGLGYAIYTVNAKAMVLAGVNSTTALAIAFGGAVPLAVLILFLGDWKWLLQPAGAGLALYLGLAPTALAYYFFGKGLIALPAATVATITLIEPVVATLLAVAFVGEVLQLLDVMAIGIVVIGLLLLGQLENRTRS